MVFFHFSRPFVNKNIKDISALTKIYSLLLWIIPILEKYPRTQKFLLADRIENLLLDIMELVINAVYSKEKKEHLKTANLKMEKLRYLIRLCKDLKYLNIKKYEYISNAVNEIGIEIGAWIKSVEH